MLFRLTQTSVTFHQLESGSVKQSAMGHLPEIIMRVSRGKMLYVCSI